MKKNNIILISIVAIILASLVYGFMSPRGVSASTGAERVVLEVPFVNGDIDLSSGISEDVWNTIPPKEIEMQYQIMVLPWGKSLISPVTVKHDFRLFQILC